MDRRTCASMLGIFLALFWGQEAETKPLPVVQIAIVEDGSSHVVPELVSLVQHEIREVTREEFDVRFPADLRLQGGWSAQGVKQALDRVLGDRRVKVVIALGFLATSDVAQRKNLPKPVIAPVALDAHLQGLPLKMGASGVKNFHYLTSLKGSERNLTAFKEIFPFVRLSVLIDGSLLMTTPSLDDRILRMAEKVGVKATVIPVTASAETALNALPSDTEAVYVSVLPRLPSSEFDRLVAGLIERRLPSFSSLGERDVDRGIAVALSPDVDVRKLARTIAVNVQRILSGTDAGQIEVSFVRGEHLTINMATVRAIDKWPTFQVLTEADLLNEEELAGVRLSLFEAVRQAMDGNLDLAAANRKVEAGVGNVGQARSDLLPQVLVGTAGLIAGRGPNTFGTGADPGQSALVLGGFRQTLYSDDIWTRYRVEQQMQVSREEERNALRLDIGQDAAVAYLNVLRAKTVRRIYKDNLKLTRSNLELAIAREYAGYALRDEVFRWESEIANGQKTVVSADAQTRQAEVALNRVLNHRLEDNFSTSEQTLDDPAVLGDTRQLFAYIENPRGFKVFREFEVEEGINAAPEMRQLAAMIAASERTILNAERAYYVPDLTMFGTAAQQYASQSGGIGGLALPGGIAGVTSPDVNSYVGGIALTFPLFKGGYKKATALKSREDLRRYQTELAGTRQRVEERVRRALFRTGASFPSIRLSQKSAEAARKTLDLVEDQYSRGAVDIIKLLNSQNAALTANEAAANAVYEFLIDLARVQRATGQMSFFQSAEDRAAWFERLKSFFANAGVAPVFGR
jgi:outer membrane protein